MTTPATPATTNVDNFKAWPTWTQNILRLLALKPQFVLSGNIRDVHLMPDENQFIPVPLYNFLWEALFFKGFSSVLFYDRVDGLQVKANSADMIKRTQDELCLTFKDGQCTCTLSAVISAFTKVKNIRVALVIDYAFCLGSQEGNAEQDSLLRALKQSHMAQPIAIAGEKAPRFNPIIWLSDRVIDMPSWILIGNEKIHCQSVPIPTVEARKTTALSLATSICDYDPAKESINEEFAKTFAELTNGMTLQSLLDITILAREQNVKMDDVDDAVRSYKVGIQESPWKGDSLKIKVRTAASDIATKLKGQDRAITKVVDILMRSTLGLTGAHASASSSRPRGILFFAGPTGTGKTEMAKMITRMIFGDERAYIRFDMSEFSSEHSDARLIGAPPGYVGYDSGGELTKAIRERPFSVVLFDEIEKAHPRILDKFLQILDDGRLTDGRGETVYFSEAIIIFTSNLGIYVDGADGRRFQNVTAEEGYDVVEHKVRTAISDHFKFRLGRPELLNRFGDNIVIFDFISPTVAGEIFELMLTTVISRVKEERGIVVEIPDEIKQRLKSLCTTDLGNGGRGVGNRIESVLTNPLARALFASPDGVMHVTIKDLREGTKGYEMVLG